MTESPVPFSAPETDEEAAGSRRRTMIIVGAAAGAAVVAAGGFFLVAGGGGGQDTQAFTPPVRRVVPAIAPTVAASAKPQAVLPVFHGSIGRDPFELPQRVTAALVPAPAPAAPRAPAAPAAPVAPVPAAPVAVPTFAVPVLGPGGGTVITVGGGTGTGTTPTTVTVVPAPAQYLQLLAAHRVASGWVVDVRTAKGTFLGVKEGTKNVGGTLFFYEGEDEQAGRPTFVFTVGESQGGNLVPNAKEPRPTGTRVKPDDSTLVLKRGQVDGGISSL